MTDPVSCTNLHDFVFGELDQAAQDEFRDHLGSCSSCPEELEQLLQLVALEDVVEQNSKRSEDLNIPMSSEASEQPERQHPPQVDELGEAIPQVGGVQKAGPVVGTSSGSRRRRQFVIIGGVVMAAAAALLIWQQGQSNPHQQSEAIPAPILLATAATRPLEMRLADPILSRYRPYEVTRSGELPTEHTALATMARLEEQGDPNSLATLAVAHLLGRDLKRADRILTDLDESAETLNNQGVSAHLQGDSRSALAFFERALAADSNLSPALWNKALVYAELKLPLSAADLFEHVARQGEPGWSDEAKRRAVELRLPADAAAKAYVDAKTTAQAAIASGLPLEMKTIKRFPDLSRIHLYDAIRSAPSIVVLKQLREYTQAIDRYYSGTTLENFLDRTIDSNWTKRKPLADRYRQLRTGTVLSESEVNKLIDNALAANAKDIAIGALILGSPNYVVPANRIDVFERLTAAFNDEWLTLLAIEQRSRIDLAQQRYLSVIDTLTPALSRCRKTGMAFRCGYLANLLSYAWLATSQFDKASASAQAALHFFSETHTPHGLLSALYRRGQIELLRDVTDELSVTIGEAYLGEILLRDSSNCRLREGIFNLLLQATTSLRDLDRAHAFDAQASRARQECHTPLTVDAAFFRAELFSIQRPDALSATRGSSGEDPQTLDLFLEELEELGHQSLSDYQRRKLQLAKARSLTHRQPATADSILYGLLGEWDRIDDRSVLESEATLRAYAYVALSERASQRGDFGEVLRLVAAEVGASSPSRCAVALVWSNDLITVVRGVDGTIAGTISVDAPPVATPVEASLQQSLDGCENISMFARSPLFGAANLLDANRAWRFVSRQPIHWPIAPVDSPLTSRLVIANVKSPAALELAPLRRWHENAQIVLEGAKATPIRVLAMLPEADWIEFHVHGLVGAVSSDDAFLVLAADHDGRYALRARDIEKTTLNRHPIVFLGACHAGQSARTYHRPYGLPTAFLKAGARAVFGSQQPIGDSDASPFFQSIQRRIRSGMSPAVALRDAKAEYRDRSPWVDDVVVFE